MNGELYGLILRTSLALVAVAALAVFVLRRLGKRLHGGGRSMRVLDRLSLDPRRTVYLVEIPGKVLVLGAGESGRLELLAEMAPDAARASLPATQAPREDPQ